MNQLTTDSGMSLLKVPRWTMWYDIVSTLTMYDELKEIIEDDDVFEIRQRSETDYFIVHKSQKFTECREICGFTKDGVHDLTQKEIHSLFILWLIDGWAEYLI